MCINAELRCSLSVVKTLGCYDCSQVDHLIKKKEKGSEFAFAAEDEHCIHQDVF